MAQSSVDSDRLSSAGISTHSSGTAGTVGGSVVGVRVGDSNLKREDEDDYNLGPLPPMWEKAFTPSGEKYFIDNNTGTSHWLDPRLARVRKHSLGECGEDELPYGWERVTDERYGSYYVDHINRRTQYENPVLQARRLRAEKVAAENGNNNQVNGPQPVGELRGERFTITLTKGTQGLGFTLIGAEGTPETNGYLQIRSIVHNSPAWIDGGLRPGDVVMGVGSRLVRGLTHAQVAQIFQSIPAGTDVTLQVVRGYPLSFDSEDPNTRVLSTLAVDANPTTPDAVAMQQLTRALRTRFNLDSPSDGQSRDEPDTSVPEHSPDQRRLMSRSFDLDELNNESSTVPPRCPSADHLLSLVTDQHRNNNVANEPGRELEVTLRRGAAGFGFTIADSVHGQKVKSLYFLLQVLDRSRCAGLREGDLLLTIGDNDVRHARHQHVVQVLKDCPAMLETTLRVWRRNTITRAPRSRSATRVQTTTTNNNQLGRSKTPTAEQLRSPPTLHTESDIRDIQNGMDSVEATYAVPTHKNRDNRESIMERRRRSSTPGARLTLPAVTPVTPVTPWNEYQDWQHPWNRGTDNTNIIRNWAENNQKWDENQKWDGNNTEYIGRVEGNGWEGNGERWNNNWGEVPTPTVHVDMNAGYWRGNASVADSSDHGGFPEDGLLPSPAGCPLGASPARPGPSSHSPDNSTGRLRSHSPSTASATDRLLSSSPSRLQSQSPSNHSSSSRVKGSPLRYINYLVEAGGSTDPEADVLVRLARSSAGFGFRIVGGTEDGSRVAVGYVVPGGPADGLLRPGDLLTSVDGIPLAGATHALAVAYVCQAASRGHVTLGVRHNRADIQALGLPALPTQPLLAEPLHGPTYNILHPAPFYSSNTAIPRYGVQYDTNAGWCSAPYDVTVTRNDGEGFGFVVISSTNKATSTIGQLIPNSPAARCGRLRVGDTIVAINGTAVRALPHPEVVSLIKRSGASVTLTVAPPDLRHD
ncbi:Membrane-associated guanylate kinase WW and PDZ domain-containing protein 2 [Danaus plexippus plexippus]|uniref:Membrane-associated guanylate kinase WW and PDZ domain-containing protein 2 n=1 Tax=Danaus plexippus plexippus TaxID=278856 RepID=A0A212F0Z5_DANPL|nr:Membrane-associated guanylate kinase WW and PDZ domain-containing protein 2 [Danaus plexippus plexippus]